MPDPCSLSKVCQPMFRASRLFSNGLRIPDCKLVPGVWNTGILPYSRVVTIRNDSLRFSKFLSNTRHDDYATKYIFYKLKRMEWINGELE